MKKIISLIMVFSFIMSTAVFAQNEYTASDWAVEELNAAAENNIIPDSLANEDLRKNISRKEFADVCMQSYFALGGEDVEVSENPFTDTEEENVIKAYSLGLVNGVSDSEFAPDDELTREQAAVMLTRVFKKTQLLGWSLEEDEKFILEYDELLVEVQDFDDSDEISDWAKDSINFLISKEVVAGVGDNMFAPADSITREQAIIIADRLYNKINEETPGGGTEQEEEDPRPEYTIVFLGGSLIYGGRVWRNAIVDYFQEKYPDRHVVGINSGIGGTGSDYGSARFCEHVAKYNPDLIFLDCTINDRGASESVHKTNMESIIRQAKALESNPAMVVLHFPYPGDKTEDAYKTWEQGMLWKNEVCDHYGVRHIDVYDYFYKDYQSKKSEDSSLTFISYIENVYFVREGEGFNVHPLSAGYEMYANAIIDNFEKDNFDPETEKIKDANIYYTQARSEITSTYQWIPISSPRMHYSIDAWTVTTSQWFPDGVRQSYQATVPALFGFDTTAEAFCMSYIATANGSDATITIDDEPIAGTLSCYSQYEGVNYRTGWIQLPNDGKVHRVVVKVNSPTSDRYIFRFGAIIERYPGK